MGKKMNKNIQTIVITIFIGLTLTLHAQKTLQEGLIIILDRNNTEFLNLADPVETNEFAHALKAHSPILVSQSIFANILLSLHEHVIPLREELLKNNTLKAWVIKELDDYYILIPKNKIDTLKNYLNITDLKIVTVTEARFSALSKKYARATQDDSLFSAALNKLFLPSSKEIAPIHWTIFLAGHGHYESDTHKGKIADLSIPEFQDVLNFLESKIKTKLLMYQSCYAGGENKIKAFNDMLQNDNSKNYTFPIIVLSAHEVKSYVFMLSNSKQQERQKFDTLFDELLKEWYTLPDYYEILKKAEFIPFLQNFPQIRLPGCGWFSIEALNTCKENNDYIVISKINALTQKKDILIEEYTDIVFVYYPTIPFKIELAKRDPEIPLYFSFMVPGVKEYHFAEIKNKHAALKEMILGIAGIAKETPLSYVIYIDKLTCLHHNTLTEFKNCIINLQPDSSENSYRAHFYGTITTKKGLQRALGYSMRISDAGNSTTFKYDTRLKGNTILHKTITHKNTVIKEEFQENIDLHYANQFPPAPPFERFEELEKMLGKRAATIAYMQKIEKQNKKPNNFLAELNKKIQAFFNQTKSKTGNS
jgi:hypothetical protein